MSTPLLSLHLSNHGSARDTVDAVVRAEQSGIERVWLSEDLFYRGAIPLAAASLVSTSRIGIGFGILAPQHRHPASLSMDIRTLTDLAPDRVTVGLGAGVAERAFLVGKPASPPLEIVSEAVSSLRTLLAGGVLDQRGVLHESSGLRLTGDVSGTVPPIFVAAVGPKALAQAGAGMDGVILTMMCSRAHASWAVARVADAAAAAGRPAVPVVAYLPVAVDPDGASAKQRMRVVLAGFIARWSNIAFLSKLFTEWSELDDERMQRITSAVAAGDDLRDLVPDALVDQFCIAGSPAECRDLAEEFGRSGITEIALDPGGDIAGALEFVRHVTGS